MTQKQNKREVILLVEDDNRFSQFLKNDLEDNDYEVVTSKTLEKTKEILSLQYIDLVLSDIRLPDGNGTNLLSFFKQSKYSNPALILITAFGSIEEAVEALKLGADDFLTKPLNLEHLHLSLQRTLETRRLKSELKSLKDSLSKNQSFHGMIGRSSLMIRLFEQVTQIAKGHSPVLIFGESGTGKELVAKAIHLESERSDSIFIPVNCASLPSELIESEFFGHEKGAFTGASYKKQGLFEKAKGGTLFLDEIGEMPIQLQAKLLRVIEEKKFRPVGSTQEFETDTRVISATNRDLETDINNKDFREDLYYRLETFSIYVPPLRDHIEDLDYLVPYFINEMNTTLDKEIKQISEKALQSLKKYHYPGNIRELKNIIERAATFCHEETISIEHFPSRVIDLTNNEYYNRSGHFCDVIREFWPSYRLPTLSELEKKYIYEVLSELEGNKRRAASVLGISRKKLYQRIDS